MGNKIDIEHLAKLSRLELTNEELEKYAEQMGGVLEYIEKLSEIKTDGEVEVGVINGVTDVMREDEVGESLPREEALKNTPAQKDGFIQVKAVFGEDKQ